MIFKNFIFTPLPEFDDVLDNDRYKHISSDMLIVKNNEKLKEIINKARKNCEFVSENDFLNYIRPSKYFLLRKIPNSIPATFNNVDKIEAFAKELRLHLIALRIIKPISSSGRICIYFYNGHTYTMSNQTRIYVSREDRNNKVNFLELKKANNIYKKINKASNTQPNRLLTSILYFELAQKGYLLMERYINTIIALECIFNTTDREVTHQIAERVALFLGKNEEERKEIFEKMKVAYRIRSKLVHGQILPTRDFEKHPYLIRDIETFFRRSVLKIINKNKLFNLYTSKRSRKDKEINKYFVNLILSESKSKFK